MDMYWAVSDKSDRLNINNKTNNFEIAILIKIKRLIKIQGLFTTFFKRHWVISKSAYVQEYFYAYFEDY